MLHEPIDRRGPQRHEVVEAAPNASLAPPSRRRKGSATTRFAVADEWVAAPYLPAHLTWLVRSSSSIVLKQWGQEMASRRPSRSCLCPPPSNFKDGNGSAAFRDRPLQCVQWREACHAAVDQGQLDFPERADNSTRISERHRCRMSNLSNLSSHEESRCRPQMVDTLTPPSLPAPRPHLAKLLLSPPPHKGENPPEPNVKM
ncbi:hypothetical protein PHYSODRAFT_303946 [Phytophthora sojae]|uniref:Uncharacterized protein n=1 Tax=Phytophthora sojae (strain P6497) TaxID=1094619 RepID=G4ZZ28_PHYSP|nr:hypothetical protein PHYSODRAFT_303941 [Phytophthora sojae]XP_009532544.1 hypothetical protein PHYSODRAFT_303946 [Phytophthora sojae]EGZ12207.1 hypothetical protein PHYSODRAFT_303941 [Phytophthora sojae]EGZ12211.1 hypothetical protein PHYSODRAFT_303946 [Phytophthora sojae]|eukprot:XP_009532540.1 hypothetical protein PHYSODRAFT_303941 [Phytophthora sojae]